MKQITKIILHNFKRFMDLEIDLNPSMNLFIGDNESGKSTILQAIDLVARGSHTKVEDVGLERLFNVNVVDDFMKGDKALNKLPTMEIDLFFNEQNDEYLNGYNNFKGISSDGIRLVCEPNHSDFGQQIRNVIQNDNIFPFEYYSISFSTFAGNSFNGYSKQLKSIFIDNSQIGSQYSINEYVKTLYNSKLTSEQRIDIKQKYHSHKEKFKAEVLAGFNEANDNYTFALKNSPQSNIETDITILYNDIPIENKGTGMQCFIKTELSLQKAQDDINIVLIEEPESHLSYLNMLKLVDSIGQAQNRQLFIATHSDLIATRLDLRNCFLINSNSNSVTSLKDVEEDTAKFFMKAPDNNLLQFVLSDKVILVEGDAEFILMEKMFNIVCQKSLKESGIGVIAVDGKCFKRYLKIAERLNIKVAVITDNDKDYVQNVTQNYCEYSEKENMKIFADTDKDFYTFECCIYRDNKDLCDTLFQTPQRRLATKDYMINNKADSAFKLALEAPNGFVVPDYIKDAIEWINA